MKLSDALKELVHRGRTTQMGICKMAGYKGVGSISTPIGNNDMHVSSLVRLANAVGYDVMLVRRSPIEPEYPIRIDKAGKVVREDNAD